VRVEGAELTTYHFALSRRRGRGEPPSQVNEFRLIEQLRACKGDAFQMLSLRRLLAECSPARPVLLFTDDEVLKELLWRARAGIIELRAAAEWQTARTSSSSSGFSSASPVPVASQSEPGPPRNTSSVAASSALMSTVEPPPDSPSTLNRLQPGRGAAGVSH
jgi:hypothetical protein